MYKIQLHSILKVYRLSIFRVLPYSLALAMLFVLLEPQTKPTFVDTTDWIALVLFIMGLFAVCMLHACIIYQFAGSIKLSFYKNYIQESDDLWDVFCFGLRKIIPVFLMTVLYLCLVAFGLVAFIVPGLFLLAIGSLSMVLIVLRDISPKNAFIEAYHLGGPNWFPCLFALLTLSVLTFALETLFNWMFKEQVVVPMFFSVLLRGFLWPLWYATFLTLLLNFSKTRIIEGSLNLRPLHQNRKQKFLHTAPNQ